MMSLYLSPIRGQTILRERQKKGRRKHFLKKIASGLNLETIHYIMSDLSTLIKKFCGKSLSTPSILTFVSGRVSPRIRLCWKMDNGIYNQAYGGHFRAPTLM